MVALERTEEKNKLPSSASFVNVEHHKGAEKTINGIN